MFRRTSRQPDASKDENISRDKTRERDKETEKKLEKLLKKAKPFFDEKLKPKARLQALFSFLEAAQAARDTESQRRFFEDYDTTVYSVMSDAFWHQVEKIRGLVQKSPEKPPFVGTKGEKDSKEVADLLKILNVLRTLLLYSAEKFQKGWMRGSVAVILRTLLNHGNHPKIRLEGLRLLLCWLNAQERDVLVPPGRGTSATNFAPTSIAKSGVLTTQPNDADAVADLLKLYEDAIPLRCFHAWQLPEPVEIARSDGMGGFVVGGKFGDVEDDSGLPRTIRGAQPADGNGGASYNGTGQEVKIPQNHIGAREAGVPLLPSVVSSPLPRPAQQRQESLELLEEILYNLILLAKAAAENPKPDKTRSEIGANPRISTAESASHLSFPNNPSASVVAPVGSKTKSSILTAPNNTSILPSHVGTVEARETSASRSSSMSGSRPTSIDGSEDLDKSGAANSNGLGHLSDEVSLLGTAVVAQQNLRTMWDLFARVYLKWLFPGVARRIGIEVIDGDGFATCPAEVLNIFVSFVFRVSAGDREVDKGLGGIGGNQDRTTSATATVPMVNEPTSSVLRQLLFGNEQCREMVHEIIRQSLLVPWKHYSVCELGIAVVREWILAPDDHRPGFLRDTSPPQSPAPDRGHLSKSLLIGSSVSLGLDSEGEAVSNPGSYVKRYIRFARMVFLERKDRAGFWDQQATLFKDVIDLYRTFSMQSFIPLNEENWETLMTVLLEIEYQIMAQKVEKAAFMGRESLQDEMASLLIETILCVWLRSGTKKQYFWNKLRDQLSKSGTTRWKPTILEWARVMQKLTKLMGVHNFGVDFDNSTSNRRFRTQSAQPGKRQSQSGPRAPALDAPTPSVEQGTTDQDDEKSRASSQEMINESPSPKISDFVNLQNWKWTAESVLFSWKNVLCVLGNVNDIDDPLNHAEAIVCLIHVWEMLALIRLQQPYKGVPLPPMFEFMGWVFQACDMSSRFSEGRAAAYCLLCRMMCRRHDQAIPEEFFSHFYRLVIKGFASDDAEVIYAIIRNSTNLFSLALPGCNILIPYTLRCIARLLLSDTRPISNANYVPNPLSPLDSDSNAQFTHLSVPENVRQGAIIILSSLISITNLYGSMTIPVLSYEVLALPSRFTANGTPVPIPPPSDSDENHSAHPLTPSMTFHDAKKILKDTLLSVVDVNVSTGADDRMAEERVLGHIFLLNALAILAFEELVAVDSPDRSIVDDCINSILNHLFTSNLKLVNSAVDCLNTLSQNFRKIEHLDQTSVFALIEKLVGAIVELLSVYASNKEESIACMIARIFYCLLEWLMCIPSAWFSHRKQLSLVFDCIESALNEGATGRNTGRQKDDRKGDRKHLGGLRDEAESPSKTTTPDEGKEDVDLVKEAAENVLLHLTHHIGHFPPPNGPAMISSSITDLLDDPSKEMTDSTLFFTFDDHTLISVTEMEGETPLDTRTRIVLRDVTGKFTWDSWVFYESLEKIQDLLDNRRVRRRIRTAFDRDLMLADGREYLGTLDEFVLSEDTVIDKEQASPHPDTVTYLREEGERPIWKPDCGAESADMVQELLQYVAKTNPDCMEEAPILEGQFPEVEEMNDCLQAQVDCEKALSADYLPPSSRTDSTSDFKRPLIRSSSHPINMSQDSIVEHTKTYLSIRPAKASFALPPLHRSRLFLNHLGFLNFESLKKDDYFHMLSKSSALFRDMRGLDKKTGRETMKIAVLYVGPDQEDELSILQNAEVSVQYEEFVSSLGWEIDLATHPGYVGGLERTNVNGSKATYFCTSTLEMIFHEASKMPNDPTDAKQLKKKRHIGNDQVHVVWNEHSRDYRRNTISGDFANAQIIVTPLPNGLYTVDVFREPKLPPFGPLLPCVVVSKPALGPLVRASCIAAYRYSVHGSVNRLELYRHSFAARARDIYMICSRHKTRGWTYQRFVEAMFGVAS
ncbi:hypothetical protein M427DRAFT_366793 [Gonapodya prolifera JEL478]|uniref:Rap-GAP domain-containing protein n=1 Tax=Gonapodya prolifera (strain JEL478) TaxID=1344416 RepID=A0A139A9T6_GONPJ|nr:hypothetical protein M427DRAFT_366793 [Gonapodya prolifera JEL478]|eukprot:KXS13439.1 hypothetical protein M427DRAFT_366793 [Gonapodya prolifera JEL478]